MVPQQIDGCIKSSSGEIKGAGINVVPVIIVAFHSGI